MLVLPLMQKMATKRPTRHYAALEAQANSLIAEVNRWLFKSRQAGRKALDLIHEIVIPTPTYGLRSERDAGYTGIKGDTTPTPEPSAGPESAAAGPEQDGYAARSAALSNDDEDDGFERFVESQPEKSNPEIEVYVPMARRGSKSRGYWWGKWGQPKPA